MIDLTYLNTTIGNDKEVIKEILNLFILQLPDLKKDIVSAYESKNWKALKDAAHKAKNSFQILGLKDEASWLYQIEVLAVKAQENDQFKLLIDSFLNSSELVTKEIENLQV